MNFELFTLQYYSLFLILKALRYINPEISLSLDYSFFQIMYNDGRLSATKTICYLLLHNI